MNHREDTGPAVSDYGPTPTVAWYECTELTSGRGLFDALQRRPPLPLPCTGAPAAVVLTRQLQSDQMEGEQKSDEKKEPLHVAWLVKSVGKGKDSSPGPDIS